MRYQPLLNRELLEELFTGTIATGSAAVGINEAIRQIQSIETQSTEIQSVETQSIEDILDPTLRSRPTDASDQEVSDHETVASNTNPDIVVRKRSMAAKRAQEKADPSSSKRVRATGGTLLAGSLDAVVEELRKGRKQRADEARSPISRALKMLKDDYGDETDLIPLALKVFRDPINVEMFLALEDDWQAEWLDSICEEMKVKIASQ